MPTIILLITTRIYVEVRLHAICIPCVTQVPISVATACEVLARRIIHVSPPDRITSMLSTRYTHKEVDGDNSDKTSALEMAIDSHWYVFLSGYIVMKNVEWDGE